MLNNTSNPFTSATTETMVSLARRNVEVFDQFTSSAKGTPMAPLFEIFSKFQHTALDSFEAMTSAVEAQTAKPASKSKTEKAAKKIVDAQAKMLADASATTLAASAEMSKAVTKAGKSAKAGNTVKLYDDLTAINGVGPATMRKLQDAGIRSIEDVASTSAKALADILDEAGIRMLKFTPKDWIADAKKLMKKAA